MPEDDLLCLSDEATADNLLETLDGVANETLHASADVPTQSDPLSHLQEELCIINNKVHQLESTLSQKVVASIQTSVPSLVADALKEHLPDLLLEALNSSFPELIKDSIKQTIKKSIKKQMPIYKSNRFVILQKELSKVIKTKMGTSIRMKVHKGIKEVRDKLKYCTINIDKNSYHIKELVDLIRNLVFLLEPAQVFAKANAEGEKWEKENPEPQTEANNDQIPNPS
ncbi:hypothetical protein Tco_1136024 [Tanacetum coccineum]